MIDGLEIATLAPRVIRYLSQNLLQSLPLTPQEIAASIEHLLQGEAGSKLGMPPRR
jgi:hypothetical protein